MFAPGILFPMLMLAGNAPNQLLDAIKSESALHLSFDHLAHKSRLASFLSRGTPSKRLTLYCWETDSQSGFHDNSLNTCETNCKTRSRANKSCGSHCGSPDPA